MKGMIWSPFERATVSAMPTYNVTVANCSCPNSAHPVCHRVLESIAPIDFIRAGAPEAGLRPHRRLRRPGLPPRPLPGSVIALSPSLPQCPGASAGAGVGRLGLVDGDAVEASNLHRQIAHGEAGEGVPKTRSLADAVARLNSAVAVDQHPVRLASGNAIELFANYDLIADASDNPATRYLINDAAVIHLHSAVTACPLISRLLRCWRVSRWRARVPFAGRPSLRSTITSERPLFLEQH